MSRRRTRVREDIDPADLVGKRTRTYIRESTERQALADRTGPALQRADIDRFVEQWGLETPEREYFDAASGRSVDGRLELQRALAEADQYDVLLVYNTSRSFRNFEDAAIWKAKFRHAGVTIVFTEPGIISGNRRTRLQERIAEIQDEEKVEEQGRMIANGLKQKSCGACTTARSRWGTTASMESLGIPATASWSWMNGRRRPSGSSSASTARAGTPCRSLPATSTTNAMPTALRSTATETANH